MGENDTIQEQSILPYLELLSFNKASDEKGYAALLSGLRKKWYSIPTIYIGTSSCGIAAGALQTKVAIENYIKERSLDVRLSEMGCTGFCSQEPGMDIKLPGKARLSFSNVSEDKIIGILDCILNKVTSCECITGQIPMLGDKNWEGIPLISDQAFFNKQKKVVTARCGMNDPSSIIEYLLSDGYSTLYNTLRNKTFEEVLDTIIRSELRGRGGGGFHTGKKWSIAFNTPHEERYLICNAEESDPGIAKDRFVIEGDPHSVIEGMALAAYAIGASKAILFIRNNYKNAIAKFENALRDAKALGIIGQNIFESGYNLEISISKGAGAFVCGEETAMINSIEGNRAMPRTKPPYPAQYGLYGKPTVINNIETLCTISYIIKNGIEWFHSIGTSSSRGTKIIAITGKAVNTGVVEVPMGTSFHTIIYDIAGGIKNKKQFKALHIGGPSGICLTAEHLNTPVDFDSLKHLNVTIGLGGMLVLDKDVCMVDLVRYFMNYMQKQSCGKCIPCREGTKRLLEIFENITHKPIDKLGHTTLERFRGVIQLEEIANTMRDTSLCGLGQKASNPVLSTLSFFRDEYEEHIFDRKCRAGVCRELREFYIEVDKCIGCGVCSKNCPEKAIIGTLKSPYFVVKEKCSGCGLCYETCMFKAITIR